MDRLLSDAARSYLPYGTDGVLIEFSDNEAVLSAFDLLQSTGRFAEQVPGATTLYVKSKETNGSPTKLVQSLFQQVPVGQRPTHDVRTHTIPVVYDGEDLASVAELVGVPISELIDRHVGPTYTVAFLGFSRSFPYFEGLDPLLRVPRLATPRLAVPARSVAMGAGFTGIYPMASPGGWRLLGRTTTDLFNANDDPPSALRHGDRVQFHRVRP